MAGSRFLDAHGEIAANPPQTSGPASWSLIAATDAPILAHFSHSDIVLEMDPKIGYP